MEPTLIRNAGPNEKRCITTYKLRLYSNLAVAAVYRIPQDVITESRVQEVGLYVPALTTCIHQHPFLSAAVRDAGSNKPMFIKASLGKPENHIRVHQASVLGLEYQSDSHYGKPLFSEMFELIHNHPAFTFVDLDRQPAWAVDILPLPKWKDDHYHSVLISFTYSHSHGDGMSGTVFHHTFYRALQQSLLDHPSATDRNSDNLTTPFPDQPDTSTSLPITLSYLLQPALGTYLPSFLTRWLGISANVSGTDDQTWTGSIKFGDDRTHGWRVTTRVQAVVIEPATLSQILTLCKNNSIKLTALLDHIIAQAVQRHLPESTKGGFTNLVATIPINLRKVLGVPQNMIGNYGGGAYLRYNLDQNKTTTFDERTWTEIRKHGQQLALAASAARNQPIGLLRFVSNCPSWLQGQIGQSRDCSWELSNLGSFNPDTNILSNPEIQNVGVKIDQIFFSQPASAVGPPITFNAVALKGGALNICITWQPGALGFAEGEAGAEDRERQFVDAICAAIHDSFEQLAQFT